MPCGLSLALPLDLPLALLRDLSPALPRSLSLALPLDLPLALPRDPSPALPRGLSLALPLDLPLALPRDPSLALPCDLPLAARGTLQCPPMDFQQQRGGVWSLLVILTVCGMPCKALVRKLLAFKT